MTLCWVNFVSVILSVLCYSVSAAVIYSSIQQKFSSCSCFFPSAVSWCAKLNAIACAAETCARIPRLVPFGYVTCLNISHHMLDVSLSMGVSFLDG